MTPQEQQMIDGLIERIRTTQITDRDPDAAAHLQQGLGGNPDAIYILAQTVLVQQHSLEQAHAQLEQMEARLEQAQQTTIQAQPPQQAQQPGQSSWLSRFFGSGTPPQAGYAQPGPGYQAVNAGQQPQYGGPAYAQPGYVQPGYVPQGYATQGYGSPQGWGQSMGGGSFLRTAAMTAAGVAAGEMLFQGVEGMFEGHHHGGYGYEGGGGGGSVVNNYYEDGGSGEHHHEAPDSGGSFYNPDHDASRGLGDLGGTEASSDALDAGASDFTDTSSLDDSSSYGDSSADDSSALDDSSSYDDSSSSDDSLS